MKNLEKILNLKYINNIYKNRIILNFIYTFIKKFIKENGRMENQIIEGIENNVNENYKLIKEQIIAINEIIARPYQIDIYKEAFKLKYKIYNDLFEPNIVMLNSNPLKNISNNIYSLNNQYYILNKLKNDINEHIILKSYVLNEQNLIKSFNEKGEILIIQSDDFTKNGDLVCESQNGESQILEINSLIKILKNIELNYKIIILCFPNSYKIKDYFYNCPYIVSFEYFNNLNSKENI